MIGTLTRTLAGALLARANYLVQAGRARLAPSSAAHLAAAALAAYKAGAVDAAVRHGERALELDPMFEPVHQMLFRMFLHGEDKHALLPRLHQQLQPRTYVEIGVETGASLRLALPGTQALGIDPQPKLAKPLPPNARVFTQTSDEFFERHDLRAELKGRPVDLALIDGMHLFEYALRDFMNLERYCAPGSTILIDDCFAHDRRTAQRKRVLRFWTGDVWKLVVLLKKYRPDLSIRTIAAPETGLCVVRNLDPASRFIADHLEQLCDEFMALDYAYLEKDRAGKLNLFPNDWEKIRPLLDSARQL